METTEQSLPAITVELSAAFHPLAGGRKQVVGKGTTVSQVLSDLEETMPGLRARIMDDSGALRWVNIFHNDDDIRALNGLETPTTVGDTLWLIPPIAGGSGVPAQELPTNDVLPTEFFTLPGANPHTHTAELRSRCPVQKIDAPPGAQSYAVLSNELVEKMLSDGRLSKQIESLPPQYRSQAVENSLLVVGNLGFADGPKHTRLRKPLARAFQPRTVEKLEPQIQRIVDDLIDDFDLPQVDLVRAFGLQVPLVFICEYLGVPVEDRDKFEHWSRVLSQDPFQHGEDELKTASREFGDYFTALAERRRDNLSDDLISELIRSKDAGQFSHEELLSTILLLIIAGHKTVANLLGNGTALLLRHPEQLELLRRQPELIPAAVEEILRIEGSAAWASMRVAAEDMEIGDVGVPKGSFVHLCLSAAGHDPATYQDPDRFDIEREPSKHLAFGHGIHFCIGASLARLQGKVAFETLLRRLPDFKLAVDEQDVPWVRDTSLSRGVESLPIRVETRLPRNPPAA